VNLIRDLGELPDAWRSGVVAIGNCDGVHRGHARIVERLLAMRERLGGAAVVFTFDPPPAHVLRPASAPAPLTWIERKAELLAELGVDAVIAYPTDEAFLKLEPREFFDRVVRNHLCARGLVEGPNFFFGRQRLGDVELLARYCRQTGVEWEIVEPVRWDGEIISSSRVRTLIAAGDVGSVREMLTQPYRIRGQVIHGAGRGSQLGYPTANLGQVDTLLPGVGIYAGRALVDGRFWPAAISVGGNPTFDEGELKIEAYLVGYGGSLYERTIEVDFLSRLRDIERFDSVGSLVSQLDRDVAATLEVVDRWDTRSSSNDPRIT
jgi:riboflavin kinase/FMN adenylyltransferase